MILILKITKDTANYSNNTNEKPSSTFDQQII